MKNVFSLVVLTVLVATVLSANLVLAGDPPEGRIDGVPLATTKDQASYAIGLNIGRDLQANLANVNAEALMLGIRDMLSKV